MAAMGAVVALLAGCGVGGSGGTKTVTVTSPPDAASSMPARPSSATDTPDSDVGFAWSGNAQDWKITVKIKKKECFGSAGCNVTYRISPEYVGTAPLPQTGTIEVTYVVKGGDSDVINTFEVDPADQRARFDSEEFVQVPSQSSKLTAKATEVEHQP